MSNEKHLNLWSVGHTLGIPQPNKSEIKKYPTRYCEFSDCASDNANNSDLSFYAFPKDEEL